MKIVKKLPAAQLSQRKVETEKEVKVHQPTIDLETLLLNGLVATKMQLETIENNQKAINQWWTN